MAMVGFVSARRTNKMDKKTTGIYNKFIVMRTDGQSEIGQKHDGCDYFVLDLTHDKFAKSAIVAYAHACEKEYPMLAADLRAKLKGMP